MNIMFLRHLAKAAGLFLFMSHAMAGSIVPPVPLLGFTPQRVFNPKDYGSFCDGTSHLLSAQFSTLTAAQVIYPTATSLMNEIDGLAIQNAFSALKASIFSSFPPIGHLVMPGGLCRVTNTIDATNIQAYAVLIDGAGTELWGLTTGVPVLNAFGVRRAHFRDLTVYGDPTNMPSTGLQIGLNVHGQAADSNYLDGITLIGYYQFSPYYNFGAEITKLNKFYSFNSNNTGSNCYGYVADGQNHWGLSSAFSTDVPVSFNESLVENSVIAATGNCVPVWMADTGRHKWITTYLANFSSGGHAVELWTGGTGNRLLDMDVHMEVHPTDNFFLTGPNATPTLTGLRYRDQLNQATSSVFKADTNITSVELDGGSIEIGAVLSTPVLLDQPSIYTGNPDVYVPSLAIWNWAAGFSGMLSSTNGLKQFFGLIPQAVFPSPLNVSQIVSAGSVSGLTITSGGSYKVSPPAINIAPPPAGGSQAAAIVDSVFIRGATPNIVNGGMGYNGTNVTLNYSGCTTQPVFHVTEVGGVVTGVSGSAAGQCNPSVMGQTSVGVTGGGGTGLLLDMTAVAWSVDTTNLTGMGAGYLLPPPVTFSAGTLTATATAALTGSFSATSGNGEILLNSTGTQLGISGATGAPVINEGAAADGSGVYVSLGATYTVPLNTSLVWLTQPGTVTASTITLMPPPAGAQIIKFHNEAGAITALSFSPPVVGWSNGSTLAANTPLGVRWDPVSTKWYVE